MDRPTGRQTRCGWAAPCRRRSPSLPPKPRLCLHVGRRRRRPSSSIQKKPITEAGECRGHCEGGRPLRREVYACPPSPRMRAIGTVLALASPWPPARREGSPDRSAIQIPPSPSVCPPRRNCDNRSGELWGSWRGRLARCRLGIVPGPGHGQDGHGTSGLRGGRRGLILDCGRYNSRLAMPSRWRPGYTRDRGSKFALCRKAKWQ